MSQLNWYLLSIVSSLDKVKVVAKSNGVYQYRINNLKNATKYLEGEGEGAPSPLNFEKSGDQKYLFLCDHLYLKIFGDQNYHFLIIVCIKDRLMIKNTFFGNQKNDHPERSNEKKEQDKCERQARNNCLQEK